MNVIITLLVETYRLFVDPVLIASIDLNITPLGGNRARFLKMVSYGLFPTHYLSQSFHASRTLLFPAHSFPPSLALSHTFADADYGVD